MTRKRCTVDLTSQLIENLNAQSKITIKVDKLLKKDYDHLGINKEEKEKKTLHKELVQYVKARKITLKRYISCLN